MLTSELIVQVRQMINDTDSIEFNDNELINLINDAIKYVTTSLIAIKDPEMMKEVTLNNGDIIPTDYFTLAGNYPAEIVGDKIYTNDSNPITIRYFAVRDKILQSSDTVPLKDVYSPVLARVVAIYALNRLEATLTQDLSIVGHMIEAIKSGKS